MAAVPKMTKARAFDVAKTWAAELPHHNWYVMEYARGKFDAVRECDLVPRCASWLAVARKDA